MFFSVYDYEVIKQELNRRPMYECRCDERSNPKVEGSTPLVVYYESIKPQVKRRLIYKYRCDERLKTKTEESTRLSDTGLVVELEHLKIKMRLIDK